MAEVRSFVYEEAKLKKKGLRFQYVNFEGKIESVMSIPFEELGRGFVTARGIRSKINKNQIFDLISFYWEDDREKEKKEKEKPQLELMDDLFAGEKRI